ncbi:MAG: hypothetical protein KDK71_01505 [Chlamydiia bacterium]|nr:hypothetical protein [Chlamydiia bacterium]
MRYLFFTFLISLYLYSDALEDRVFQLEQEMKEVGITNESGTYGAGFTSAEFEKGWIGLQFFGSPLYWHAKVGGTEYVYEFATNGSGKEEAHSFDWDWGYRFGSFIRLPIVKWEIIGTYTHFGTTDKEGRGVLPPSLLISLKGGATPPHYKATSDYKIDYDNVALTLAQSSFLSRLFGIGTEIGVRKTWLEQRQGVTYEGVEKVRLKDRCRFEGIGPQLGLKLHWYLLSDFSFLSQADLSLLYGNFHVKHSENQTDILGHAHFFAPAMHFFLGLNWGYPFRSAKLNFSIGYEAEYFWRQNQSIKIDYKSAARAIQLTRIAEDLTFYGVTTKCGVEF